jgi:hypothetical protein
MRTIDGAFRTRAKAVTPKEGGEKAGAATGEKRGLFSCGKPIAYCVAACSDGKRYGTISNLGNLGGRGRDRTGGLIVANDALSQLSYTPTELVKF